MSHAHAKIYLHPRVERFWHWVHAACITLLAITGIGIHWPGAFALIGGLDLMVTLHNTIAWITMIDFALFLAFNAVLGRFHYYVPKKRDVTMPLIRQVKFYAMDAFLGFDNPGHPTLENKFNPLQKFTYIVIMFVFMPLVIGTGLLYLYPVVFGGVIQSLGGLTVIAIVHFVLAAILTAFMFVHVYLCTLGVDVKDDFRHMITGYAPAHEDH